MAKIKIHEIAKKIGVTNKDVLDKAAELGIKATSHLNAIEESEAKKIEKEFSRASNPVKKEVKEKNDNPVIIRREVIVSENPPKQQENTKKSTPSPSWPLRPWWA